jgi:hypothetical protein
MRSEIDWRAGEMLVHGKARREERTPIPVDVRDPIVSYLRARPVSGHRRLFLCVLAPFGPISSSVRASRVG